MLTGAEMLMGNAYPPFSATLSRSSVSGSSSSSTVTSGSVSAQPQGGSGQRLATWTRTGGNSAIVATAPNSLTTAFQATGLSAGADISATFQVVVTDAVTGQVLPAMSVTVRLVRDYPALSITSLPNASSTQTSSTTITVSASTSVGITGGVSPFTYTWSMSGDFTMSGSGASRTFSRALGPQGGVSGTATVTVTDAIGQTASATCSVLLINNGSAPPPLSISASPTSVSGFSNSGNCVTNPTTITVSGGKPPYQIYWDRVSGVGLPSGGFTSTFSYNGGPVVGDFYGTFLAVVVDAEGTGRSVTISAQFSIFFISNPIA